MSETRVLPADVYDTLELSALAYGGIGAGRLYDAMDNPLCAIGHAIDSDERHINGDMRAALFDVGIEGIPSDVVVQTINHRRGASPNARVPFRLWRECFNVVRGD